MRKRKYLLGTLLTMLLAISLVVINPPATSAQTRPIVTVPLMLAPFGTGGYVMGFATADISKRHPWLRIAAAETPGYVYNIKAHNADPAMWKTHILGSGTQTFFLAEHAAPPVSEKITGYRMLLNNEIPSFLLVTFDPKIKTLKDLVGKKVALGLMTQVGWGVDPLEHMRAVGLAGPISLSHVGPMPAMHALLDGTVAACITVLVSNPLTGEVRLPPQFIELLATGKKLYYIPFGKEAIDKLNAKGWPGIPWTLPAGKLKWQTEDLPLNATLMGWASKETFPEDLAYEITKLHIDRYKELGPYHAQCELFSPELYVWGLNKKIVHPGAIRAFREAGIKIPD